MCVCVYYMPYDCRAMVGFCAPIQSLMPKMLPAKKLGKLTTNSTMAGGETSQSVFFVPRCFLIKLEGAAYLVNGFLRHRRKKA